MEFRFMIVMVACVCCAVPPVYGKPIGVASALAVIGAAKGAALLGAKAVAAKGLAALAAKGAIVSGVAGAALAKTAAIKGAALLAAKGAALKGAVVTGAVLKGKALLAANRALTAVARASAQPTADIQPDLQEDTPYYKNYVQPEEAVAVEPTPSLQENVVKLAAAVKSSALAKAQSLNDIIMLLSPDESETPE